MDEGKGGGVVGLAMVFQIHLVSLLIRNIFVLEKNVAGWRSNHMRFEGDAAPTFDWNAIASCIYVNHEHGSSNYAIGMPRRRKHRFWRKANVIVTLIV